MAQQRALAASAATHDDEDVAAPNNEVEIAHQNETAVRHRQVLHDDVLLRAGAIPASDARSHREPRSDPQEIEDHGEQTAGDNDHYDRHHHRLRRRIADRR